MSSTRRYPKMQMKLFDGNVDWTYQEWRNKKTEKWRKTTKNWKWRKRKSQLIKGCKNRHKWYAWKIGSSCRRNGKINRKLHEVIDSKKNGQLWKLCYWENVAENVEKGPKEKLSKPGFCVYVDIASSKFTSAGGSKYWFLAVDEATHMKFSLFLKQKSDVKEKFIPFLKEFRDTYGRRVHHIRCDNAGESSTWNCMYWQGIWYCFWIYSTRNTWTKWHRGKSICEMLGKPRAIMNWTGFDEKKRHLFWKEATNTITHI